MTHYTIPRLLFTVLLAFATSASVLAAPIDEQTPTPDASLLGERMLAREHCLGEAPGAVDGCVSVQVAYPSSVAVGVDDYIHASLVHDLGGDDAHMPIEQAAEAFLLRRVRSLSAPGAHDKFTFSWQALGKNDVLITLVKNASELPEYGDGLFLRDFVVLDLHSLQPLVLADVLVSGQGEMLAGLQEQALLDWFVYEAGMDVATARAAVEALPVRFSDSWTITRDGLAFVYAPVLLAGERIALPVVTIPAAALEGVVRPDILTMARSWPVDVRSRLYGFEVMR